MSFILQVFAVGVSAETVTPLYSFRNGDDGAAPTGGLVEAGDGHLYGTTASGGVRGNGTIFRFTKAGVFTSLYSFTNGVDGLAPVAELIQARDGHLYGTATAGGTNGFGTVFRITTGGVMTPLYSFRAIDDGAFPMGGLVQGADGNLYGTTFGGVLGFGSVYQISPSGALAVLHKFTNGDDGGKPEAVTLVQAKDGGLYGTTSLGGRYGSGTVFRIGAGGEFASLYSFSNQADGARPRSGLTEGRDGYLYGTTPLGGTHGAGVVYRINSGGDFSVVHTFTGGANGRSPLASLVEAGDGFFYGRCGGGKFGQIFAVHPNGTFRTVFALTQYTGGATPPGVSLIRASDGAYYGTGPGGGTNLYGTVFRVSSEAAPPVQLQSPRVEAGRIQYSFPTVRDGKYAVEMKTDLLSPQWTVITSVTGDGREFEFTSPTTPSSQAFFRVRRL